MSTESQALIPGNSLGRAPSRAPSLPCTCKFRSTIQLVSKSSSSSPNGLQSCSAAWGPGRLWAPPHSPAALLPSIQPPLLAFPPLPLSQDPPTPHLTMVSKASPTLPFPLALRPFPTPLSQAVV